MKDGLGKLKARERQLNSTAILLVGVVLLGFLSQVLLGGDYFVGLFNDDAGYLEKIRYMLYGGVCPVCHLPLPNNIYGIGWPLFLAPFAVGFGDNLDLYPVISRCLTVIFVLLATELCRREFGRTQAFWMALVLLSSTVVLSFGSTLMSEPFYSTLIITIVWLEQSRAGRACHATQGALAGICAYVRPEGLCAILALLVVRALQKQLQALLWTLLSFALAWLSLRLFLETTPGAFQLGMARQFFAGGPSLTSYLVPWFANQLLTIGHAFFYGPSWLARALSLSLIGIVGYGAATSPKVRNWLGLWLILGTFGALLFWPYLGERYWFMSLPLWLLASLRSLPPKPRKALLPLLLLVQLFFVGQTALFGDRTRVEATRHLYESLRQTEAADVVATVCPARTHVLSHRQCVLLQTSDSLGPVALGIARQGATVMVWEYEFAFVINMQGNTQILVPQYFGQWIERSTLFSVIYKNDAGLVVRLRPSKEALERAFASWREAMSTQDLELRKRLIEEALEAVPDLHELRALWLITSLDLAPSKATEILDPMRAYFRQYPHDFGVAQILIEKLRTLAMDEPSREIAALCHAEAVRLKDPGAREIFERAKGLDSNR